MTEEPAYPRIDMSHIRVGGGVAGFIFTAGSVYIFLVGVPALRWFFVWAIVAGAFISIALGLFHKHKPARPVTFGETRTPGRVCPVTNQCG
jgi:hypothetical protein